MKIFGLTRIQNAERWLFRLLSQYNRICERIFVLDDRSTDDTRVICKQFPKVTYFYQCRNGIEGNWRFLWKVITPLKTDWVIGLDGDELFEEHKEKELLDLLKNTKNDVEGWSFPLLYLWNDEEHYRVDKLYKETRAIRVFRFKEGLLPEAALRHITAKPEELNKIENCDSIKIKHFGYMLKSDRDKKYEYYCIRDKDLLEKGKVNYDHFAPNVKDVVLEKVKIEKR